jgi:hypothetical protein
VAEPDAERTTHGHPEGADGRARDQILETAVGIHGTPDADTGEHPEHPEPDEPHGAQSQRRPHAEPGALALHVGHDRFAVSVAGGVRAGGNAQ